MTMEEDYPVGYVHYGLLEKLSSMVDYDLSRIPRAGWTGTLQDLGAYMGLDPEMLANELGYSLADHDDAGAVFDISPPPARPDALKQKPEVPMWRKHAAHLIDPATTQRLLGRK